MNMNKQVLHTAVALALGSVASAALAYDPFNPATPTAYEVRFSGATASSNTVRNWIIDNMCNGVDVRVYRRGTVPFGNDWAVACTTKGFMDINGDGVNSGATETIPVQNVLFRKRDTGGSFFGVSPVTDPTGVEVSTMSITSANCTEILPATIPKVFSCGATTDNKYPDAGFSDIEPDKFVGINVPSGSIAFKKGGPVITSPFGALVFNTPVTKDLRDALQRVQFDKATNPCNPIHPGYNTTITPPPNYTGTPIIMGESEACMPSLTTTEIRSLFTSNVPTWDNFLVTPLGAGPGVAKVALAAHADNAATAPADKRVQICRRVNGSGTQAQFNAIFTNYPCILNGRTATSEPGNVVGTLGPRVANNSGSSDVGKCLADFNDATNVSLKNPIAGAPAPNNTTVKRWAIGVQSTENNVNMAQNYRFIKINGYAPTIQSVVAGDYEDFAEQSFQYRTVIGGLTPTPMSDPKLKMFRYLAAQGNTPNDMANVNLDYVHKWGQGGWLVAPKISGIAPGAAPNPSNPFSLLNPVNSSTRAPNNAALNICQFPTTIKQVEVDTGFSTGKH